MEKKTFEVAQGVAWVNGSPVPKDRKVVLTDAEAQYDLALGRITPVRPAPSSQVKGKE